MAHASVRHGPVPRAGRWNRRIRDMKHVRLVCMLVGIGLGCADPGESTQGSPTPSQGSTTPSAPPEKAPAGAQEGPVATLGAPFDPNSDPYYGPDEIMPGGIPRVITVVGV